MSIYVWFKINRYLHIICRRFTSIISRKLRYLPKSIQKIRDNDDMQKICQLLLLNLLSRRRHRFKLIMTLYCFAPLPAFDHRGEKEIQNGFNEYLKKTFIKILIFISVLL